MHMYRNEIKKEKLEKKNVMVKAFNYITVELITTTDFMLVILFHKLSFDVCLYVHI